MIEKTLRLYRFYCYLNLIWYAALTLFSITTILVLKKGDFPGEVIDKDQSTMLLKLLFMMLIMSWVFFAITLTMMKPVRTRKWWIGGSMNIYLGITTCCLAPFCIPLAIKWNAQEFKDYFDEELVDKNSDQPSV